MSFQSLISGSECGAPSNPLSQVLKHTEGDRSLQQDRISGSSSSRLHQLPTSSAAVPASEQDLALARQFFEGNNQGHGFATPHPAELARMNEMHGSAHHSEPWMMDQHSQMRFEDAAKSSWATEFGGAPQMNLNPHNIQQGPISARPEFQQIPSYASAMGAYSQPMGMLGGMNGSMQYGMNANYGLAAAKGKGKEVDFDAAFAQFAEETQTSTSRIEEVDEITESLQSTTLESKQDEGELGTDFQKVWENLQASDLPPPQEDMAKWEAEFSQLMSAQREESEEDYGANMQNAWENGLGDYDNAVKPTQFDAEGIPILGDYEFEKNNIYLEHVSKSLLDEAKALLEQNGSLSEAALMLEAAIQQGQLGEGGYEAWILLGETRNMDEREEAGMRALLQGVKKAEEANAGGAGMMSLAISFTNESYDRASHTMLLRWFRARFPDVPVPETTIKAMSTNSSWDTHGRITDLFLELARTQHARGDMDPDLQIGLGVLFYTNGEYDRAQDCFSAALNARPRDYLLWNRLGSSLSNGNKPEEALGAYREALEIRPTYTRAIYNVGVACLNIGADKEAAEHFLSALSLQESTNGDTSSQLWFTLRRALMSMGRNDLADLAKPEVKSNLEMFRREGFDF